MMPRRLLAAALKSALLLAVCILGTGFTPLDEWFDLDRRIQELPASPARTEALLRKAELALHEFYALNPALHALDLVQAKDSGATPAMRRKAATLREEARLRRDPRALTPAQERLLPPLLAKLRPDRPRLFLTRETVPLLRERLRDPRWQAWCKRFFDDPLAKLPSDPPIWTGAEGDGRLPDGRRAKRPKPMLYGTLAAACAMHWLADGDEAARDRAIQLLEKCGEVAAMSFDIGVMAGDYYNTEMLHALAAFDWIADGLDPETRRRLIKPLLEYAVRCRTECGRFVSGESEVYEGGSYGTRMLSWYAGVAAYGTGADDAAAAKLLAAGYEELTAMLKCRDWMAGDDGGFITPANNYLVTTYPWGSFHFLASLESALGLRLTGVRHLTTLPRWIAWNRIRGVPLRRFGRLNADYDFGAGDTGNDEKLFPVINTNLYELTHFIADDPAAVKLAAGLFTGDPLDPAWPAHHRPFAPLLAFRAVPLPETYPETPPELDTKARFFPWLGIAFFRSGSAPGATHACFVTNKRSVAHRHFDSNSFMIFKYDFLALDTGTRIGYTGTGGADDEHLLRYYAQSVAHNTILIHMPEEPMPSYWGRDNTGFLSHGGQYRTSGDRCIAFETHPLYSYIAGDATAMYRPEKCEQAIRQFVFLPPSLFIIADRVRSTRPEYRKEWLLHLQHEPAMLKDQTFSATEGEGVLFCRTLLPERAQHRTVGGPGHAFEASGRNWELPEATRRIDPNHFGNWRVEISPATAEKETLFLHVIEVGKRGELTAMRPVRRNGFGVDLSTPEGDWEIRFAATGAPGGTVRLRRGGRTILDRPLAVRVEAAAPQSSE